jgi:metal-responsive CopG/Arc/MetJ family transcriptional regulator
MNTVRLNITLPQNVGKSIRSIKNKSAFIAEAIRERLDREDSERLATALKEGYTATKEEDKKITKEWDCVIGDGLA